MDIFTKLAKYPVFTVEEVKKLSGGQDGQEGF
jgi:hypothetical protein